MHSDTQILSLITKAKKEIISPDKVQLVVIEQLQKIADQLSENVIKPKITSFKPKQRQKNNSIFSFFAKNKKTHLAEVTSESEKIKGMYIWGDVGRGKTWLMDLFYESVNIKKSIKKSQRIHFHEFMLQVHKQLQNLPKQPDPLDIIGKNMSQQYDLICLDEFHVMDIADAVILHGLLHSLFANNVTIITTSNRHPDDLYKNGSHRERFLPAIELIKQNTHVVHLDAGKDYRQQPEDFEDVFLIPHTPENNDKILQSLDSLFIKHTNTEEFSTDAIKIYGREIPVIKKNHKGIWFSFDTLCRGARSSSDYLQIAKQFPIVVLSEIPVLYEGEEGPARRFLNLIDSFYDQHTLLILSSSVEIEEMYQGNLLQFEFKRALSRLHKMCGHSWWMEVIETQKENQY